MRTYPQKSRHGVALLVLMPILALAAIYWKVQHDKFPYVGTWAGTNSTPDGGTNTMVVGFDGNGGCSWLSDKVLNGKRGVLHFRCSYHMRGNTALVSVQLHDTQIVRGKWRFAKTARERTEAPLIKMVTVYRVTPLQEGNLLLVEGDDSKFVNQETGQSKPNPYQFRGHLQRQKKHQKAFNREQVP